MVSEEEMLELHQRSLERAHPDQLELCFWEVENDQLVFA